MYKTEVQKISDASVKKIAFMKKSPLSYILLSALAGIYLGFGLVLIFFYIGSHSRGGGRGLFEAHHGSNFWNCVESGYFRGV